MPVTESARGRAVIMQPGEGLSYWQPVPANGYGEAKLIPADTNYPGLSMGFQTIPPGGRVREHSHGSQIELQICFRGNGRMILEGTSHPLTPGTSCFLGY
ncbi:MAG: cupin domain-containing protein, partial [Burkholderiales bacterium]